MEKLNNKHGFRKTLFEKLFDLIGILALIAMIIYVIAVWKDLPAQIPSHYNGLGEIDAWDDKSSLLPFLIIGIAVWLGSTIMERFPQVHNQMVKVTEENKARLMHNSVLMLNVMKNIAVIYFCYLTWRIVQDAYGRPSQYAAWDMPIFLIVLFGSMGYFIYRSFKLR